MDKPLPEQDLTAETVTVPYSTFPQSGEPKTAGAEAVKAEIAVTVEDESRADLAEVPKKDPKPLFMHAIKCKCGDILSRKMKNCPSCGKGIELLLEELRQDFHRVNFTKRAR